MKDVIRVAIEEALSSLGLAPADFTVEHPAELFFGDFASNAALVCAKEAGRNPRELADALKEKLEGQIEYVDRIEVAGPGFLNFTLAREFFAEEAMRILELGDDWGANTRAEGKEVLIEYTSPNLFKPLHVGNLVGNITGEAIARLYERSGAAVRRINYPSDIGLTVAKGVWGLSRTGGDPRDINALGEAYRFGNEAYETSEEGKSEIEAVNRLLYAGTDEALNALRSAGLATSKAKLDALCAMLGTTFDTVIYESEASPRGAALVKEHIGDVFEESDGAVVYKGEKVGLHTRVFLNSQGLPTYEAKDLGNFAIKEEKYPSWDVSLIVTGSEQTEYFKVLYAALREVFAVPEEKELGHIPTGFLTLTTGKMSSRKGNVLTGESVLGQLVEEAREKAKESRAEDVEALTEMVAVAALKYQILKQSPGSNIVFDTARALSFEGDSGPYLQYTYARARSVAAKADSSGVAKGFTALPEKPYDLERILCRFEEAVRESFEEYAPHVLLSYLTALAGMFNTFYAQERIADASDPYAPYKRALVEASAITLRNGLSLLGMKAPEQM
jgi:arginyl-tRNA synthetase